MKGRPLNAEERRWMNDICNLDPVGCVVCWIFNGVTTPAAPHHIDGKTKMGVHLLTIPLCPKHHQEKDNQSPPRWISRHGDGRRAFEAAYGTEADLLEFIQKLVNRKREMLQGAVNAG